jgi:hypothetical protein
LLGDANHIVSLSQKYKIDDAVALAFFVMESRAGTVGEAIQTQNVGNVRPMPDAPVTDGYRQYRSWLGGVTEWFHLVRNLYLDKLRLRTVEVMVPVYAPATDNNDPVSMVAGIRQLVACWRGDVAACPPDPRLSSAMALPRLPAMARTGRR